MKKVIGMVMVLVMSSMAAAEDAGVKTELPTMDWNAVQANMQLVVDTTTSDRACIDRDLTMEKEFTVEQGRIIAQSSSCMSNPLLKTMKSYKDAIVEIEFVLNPAQKGALCVIARTNEDAGRVLRYGFYIYPSGLQCIELIEWRPNTKTTPIGRVTTTMSIGKSHRLKIGMVGDRLAMKTWPGDQKEPAQWLLEVADTNQLKVGIPLSIEVQRDGTPGNCSVEFRAIKVWTTRSE